MNDELVTDTARAFLVQAQRQLEDGDTKGAARSAHEAALCLGAPVPPPPRLSKAEIARLAAQDRNILARLLPRGISVPDLFSWYPGRKQRRRVRCSRRG